MNDEQLFDFTNAVLATQSAILLGLINAKVVEADKMRAFLKSLIDDLKPEERKQAYGVCLYNVLSAIETMALPKPKPASLN
ncbi:MAG: hypothetical protein GEV13_28295 [Rhodospirillales bacterium]|nr:hypothetical protein [Rhodospirillales bacterium]